MAAEDAIKLGSRLGDIGFPEFTCKLITDTFDALISANIRQTESYLELVKTVETGVSKFIKETKDEISGEMILEFLSKVLPDNEKDSNELTKVRPGGKLTDEDAELLKKEVELDKPENPTNPDDPGDTPITAGTIDDKKYKSIIDAVAKRIANDKYKILQTLVNQGFSRLVVDNGEIETKLTFNVTGKEQTDKFNTTTETINENRNINARGFGVGWGGLIRGAAHANYNKVTVSTATVTAASSSSVNIDVFGHVKINFRTDYNPLKRIEA
ncbi:conserved hypothetical protein [Paraburkholderia tropica]